MPGAAWQNYNRKPPKWSHKVKGQMYKMAVNTCETIRSNRRIQQLGTLNRDELIVKLEAAFAQTSLANCHDNLQVIIGPTADDHLAKTSPFETSLGTGWEWRDS